MNRPRLASLVMSLLDRRGFLRRTAPVWVGLVVVVGSAIPGPTGVPKPIPFVPTVPTVFAGDPCSSHTGEWTTFTGHLSNSSGTMLSESTTGSVYGRVSNVDRTWQLSPGCGWYRYDAVIWATSNDTTHLTVDWGALSGDQQPCIYLLNTTDYLHANFGTCPPATTARLVVTLPAGSYHNDIALNNTGNFAFAHSDCDTLYGTAGEKIINNVTTSVTSGEPGANCGNKQLDGTGTTQTLVVDGTAPSISFTAPAAGGPVVVPSAFYSVVFNATDAVAGFGGADDWDLQRQKATWDGSVCGTFANDGAAVSGTTNATNQVSNQSLALNSCYRWTLAARDQNGNTATTITSGSIRTDTSGLLGSQPQFRTEGWDLGGGDSLSVSVGSGNVRVDHPIVSLPIRAGTLDLSLSYNSHDSASIGMGPGWRLNVQRRLKVNADNSVTFTDEDGSRHTFTNPTGSPTVTYTRPATLYATLTRDMAATPDRFMLTYRDQSVDVFDEDLTSVGLLKQIKDRFGNTVSVAYTAGTDKISTITDPASRTISFTWTGSNLTQIVDWANVSGGIIQTSGTGNRTHRFFYDGSNNLIGWADPLNTSGTCPTGGSHVTCLTNTAGFLTAVAKTQTYETISGNPGTLGSATRTITTNVAYASADAASVTDAEAAQTVFSHPNVLPAGQTKVVHPGTPASETTYALVSMTDTYGRIGSVKRKLGAAQIETLTTYDATYPLEPATVTEDNGGSLQRSTGYTYQASSLGLLFRLDEPLDGTYNRRTEYTYNANNDVTRKYVYSTDASPAATDTRYCYSTSNCFTTATDLLLRSQIDNYIDGTAGGAAGNVEDITTTFQYDAFGQRTRSTRSNYASGGVLLDSAATGFTYDTNGNATSEIDNHVDGTVTNPGDDITPNATTNARTDLTTTFTYDTAGNKVSSADPRRAIEAAKGTSLAADDFIGRTVFDALNQGVASRLPSTPGQADCSPTPACREATSIYDELGAVREGADINDLVTATKYDKAGRALETYEDPVSTTASITTINTYDAQGLLLTSKNREQSKTGSTLGYSQQIYDELGRMLAQAQAVGTSVDTETDYGYDALDRQTSMITGVEDVATSQATVWTFDIGGRTSKVDDEFTCTSTTYDYRDLALTVTEGQASGSCSGAGIRTVTNTYDGLGRLTLSQVTAGTGINDKLVETTYDGVGNTLTSSATTSGVITSATFTLNRLDQTIAEVRSNNTWAKTNYDAAGGATDRCLWSAAPTDPCMSAGSTFNNPQPTQVTTTTYDGRNKRISLRDAVANTTTTYDPNHNYQLWAVYLPTGGTREHQTVFAYDARHRLTTLTQMLCATADHPQCTGANILTTTASDTYGYDDNDNKNAVTEANGAATLVRGYCLDAVERVTSTRDTAGCAGTSLEAYTYDDSGNRTAAGSTTFTYDAQGQLATCSTGCGTVAFDAAGRTQKWNGWFFEYDAEGRMTWACQATAVCSGGLYNEIQYTYDGEGHRTQIKQFNAGSGSVVATWDFRYQGDAIVEEKLTDAAHPSGTVVRSYVVDEAGSVVKMTIPAGETSAGTYLVTWNGHGDAMALWRIEADGSLTLANSYTYSTWGKPTTAVAPGSTDLGFRFLYVGEYDVQWDNVHSLGLEYMHARHYSPALGRFLQPDPDGSESNLYAYASNNPVTEIDPDGTCFIICAIVNAVVDTAIYLATTDSKDWSIQGAATAAVTGAVTGFLGVGLLSKVAKIGAVARFASRAGSFGRSVSRAAGRFMSKADNTVYLSRTSGVTRYVGITKNFVQRSAAHGRIGRSVQQLQPGGRLSRLNRFDAHSVEQAMINRHGLGKYGGTLTNKINSVARTDPLYRLYAWRGERLLRGAGM